MAFDKNTICNMALAHVAVGVRLLDVDTEPGVEAQNCRLFYEPSIKILLEMQVWDFAKRQVQLQDLGTPPDEWQYRYAYPNNCALALRIINPYARNPNREQRIPYQIVNRTDSYGKAILTDQEDAILEFNESITDPTLFSATFAYGLSLFIASNIAMPLSVSDGIRDRVRRDYLGWMAEASSLSLRQSQEDKEPESEYLAVRG